MQILSFTIEIVIPSTSPLPTRSLVSLASLSTPTDITPFGPPDMHNGQDQAKLSEMLQLLAILDDNPLPDPGTEHIIPLKIHQTELRILNSIANFVSNGSSDFVCVVLDKTVPLNFLLSKNNGPPQDRDRLTAAAFFGAMRKAETWQDVMPSLLLHQSDHINNTLATLTFFPFEGIPQIYPDHDEIPALSSYVPLELKDEFSEGHLKLLVGIFKSSDPLVIIRGLFHRIRERSNFKIALHPTSSQIGPALNNLRLLIATSETMLQTRFLREQLKARVAWALQYRDLLRNVTCYQFGINELIGWRRRFIPESEDIPFSWIFNAHNAGVEPAGTMLVSSSARKAIESLSDTLLTYRLIPLAEYQIRPVAHRLDEQWNSTLPPPCRHAIPRTISELDASNLHYSAWPRVMGSSAPPCLCCARWLTEYNDHHQQRRYPAGARPIQWVTSNPRTKVDVPTDWSLAPSLGSRAGAVADDDVFGMILDRVTDVLKSAGLLRNVSDPDSDMDDGLYDMVTEKTYALFERTGLVNSGPWRPSPTMGGFQRMPLDVAIDEEMDTDAEA
ncbi:hypothetical protein HWV62_1208 [Athelia sp. TMB]|nr:hypothetical protein HWV62_1208 [Athelia sp. TMB]